MNGSDSGGIFRQPMPPVTSPPPANRYPPGVTGGYTSGGGGGNGGSGGVGFRQNINININEHGSGEPIMKRRGRPRKYGPGGSMSPPGVSASSLNGGFEMQRPRSDAVPVPPIAVAPVSSVPMEDGFGSVKRMRGRPPGSLNKKRKRETYVGASGLGYTPHIIMVQPGEDVFNKIMSFSQTGPRAVCVMSGTGVLNNVTLRQTAISGGTATYEGRFDILSLSGSFVPTEVHGQRTRTGGLSITLSGSGDQVFGGVVAGLLTAASPVQVVAGTFLPENCNEPPSANHVNPSSAAPKVTPANHSMGPSSPPSHGTLSESSGGSESPLNRGNESRPRNMAWLPWN